MVVVVVVVVKLSIVHKNSIVSESQPVAWVRVRVWQHYLDKPAEFAPDPFLCSLLGSYTTGPENSLSVGAVLIESSFPLGIVSERQCRAPTKDGVEGREHIDMDGDATPWVPLG